MSFSGERESEAEPEPDAGPAAAAVDHSLPVQHHAHQGERHSGLARELTCSAICDLVRWRPQENESLRSRVQQLELSLQQRAEQLSHLERQSEQTEWRRGEELRKREERVRELQLELDRERGKEPAVKAGLLSTAHFTPFLLNAYLLLLLFFIFCHSCSILL